MAQKDLKFSNEQLIELLEARKSLEEIVNIL